MANLLQLTLFGSPEVQIHGQPVTGFRSSKAQALLYYLAVTGRPHTRPTLAGLLWGDQPETAARISLSKCLSNLRELVGEAVLVDRQTVAFNRGQPYHLDTERFLADIGQPPTLESIHTWQAALVLYRGDFLEGFYVREAPDFEQWVLVQRAHYREAVVQGLYTLAYWHDQQSDLPQAISHTRRLLTLEPWREEAHRQLMTRLARSGQRAAALAQFETCRLILDEELAVEPDAETVALMEAIRAGGFDRVTSDKLKVEPFITLSPLHPGMNNLPIPPTPLIGRERELAELAELINNSQCRLITITGPGGIGKTRLALAAAAEQHAKFQQGAIFASLAGVSSAQFLPQAILSALNLPLQSDLSPQQQVRTVLYNQERLLILDNYEHLLPDIDLLLDLLYYAPKITLLVTSRERLALRSEHLYELNGLGYPHETSTKVGTKLALNPTGYAAIQLFLQRVRQTQLRFNPDDKEMAAIIRICCITEGLPLALELAAAVVREQSCVALAAALEQGQARLSARLRDLPERHRTIEAVFEHSWHLLSDSEQQVLTALAVFRGGFEAEAAQEVASATPAILTALIDKSWLRCHPSGRYGIHELVRQFGQEQLSRRHELQTTQQRHADYFIALAEEADHHFFTDRQRLWIERLECEHDNLRAVLTWALEHRVTEYLLRLACALQEFWDCRGYYLEMNRWLEQALVLAEQAWGDLSLSPDEACEGPMRARLNLVAHALFARANALMHDRESAEVLYSRSLLIDQRIGPTPRTMEIFQALSWIERRRGNFDRADELQRETLQLAQTLPDFQGQERQRKIAYAIAIGSLNALFQADLARSATLATQALSLWDAVEDRRLITYGVSVLGHIALRQKNFERAHSLLTDCYRQFIEDGDTEGVVFLRCLLGILALQRGDWRVAQTAFIENLTWLQHYNRDHDALLHNLRGLADALRQRGEGRLAAQLLGAVEKLRQMLKYVIAPIYQPDFEETLTAIRAQLDATSFAAAYAQGYAMTLEQAMALALATI